MQQLNENFLAEFLKLCTRKRDIIDIAKEHLKFHHIPKDLGGYKEVWEAMRNYYISMEELPTIGVLSQMFDSKTTTEKPLDKKIYNVLSKIKEADIISEKSAIDQLEKFIKWSMATDNYDKFYDFYTKGERDKAIDVFSKAGEELSSFTLKRTELNTEGLFKSFAKRMTLKYLNKESGENLKIKTTFGLDEMDLISNGGCDVGDTFMMLAQSGMGKTKYLRWCGVSNARKGFKVLHIQLEGSKEEAEDGYDATWTALKNSQLEYFDIEPKQLKELELISKQVVESGGEIYLESFEEFDSASCLDVKDMLNNFVKIHGVPPDLVLIDYFELLEPGDGKKYSTGVDGEKARRQAIGKKLKNLAMIFKTRIGTATQASNISSADKNDPDFVMRRTDVTGDKNVVNPFSYFFTFNQTDEEYKLGLARIFNDKVRKYKRGQVIKFYQAYEFDKFYDRQKTLREIHNYQ